MPTKLDYTQWNHVKEKIYDIIIQEDTQKSAQLSSIMAVLETEKIIKLKDETDTERERTRKPKPVNPNRGRYRVERPKAKLSCGCVFDYSRAEDDGYCDYHSMELGATTTAILTTTTEETEGA